MWLSTAATVWLIRGTTAFRFDRPNGLPSDKAFAILDDGRGTLWMTSNKGLRAAKIADLDRVCGRPLAVLPSRLFGTSDGMTSAECMLAGPGAVRLADGTVWFCDHRGRRPHRSGAAPVQLAPAAGRHGRGDGQRPRHAATADVDRSVPAPATSKSAIPRSAS